MKTTDKEYLMSQEGVLIIKKLLETNKMYIDAMVGGCGAGRIVGRLLDIELNNNIAIIKIEVNNES